MASEDANPTQVSPSAVGGDDALQQRQASWALGSFGDYELLEEIARGGMGVVYKARQRSLNRTVAIKMIRAGAFASKEFVHRFRTEAAAAAVLQHPNIVAVHEVGVHEGEHFFSMDFVAGRDLQQIVRDGPLSPRRAGGYVQKIAESRSRLQSPAKYATAPDCQRQLHRPLSRCNSDLCAFQLHRRWGSNSVAVFRFESRNGADRSRGSI